MTLPRPLLLAALALATLVGACAQGPGVPLAPLAPVSPGAEAYCLGLRAGGDEDTDAGLGGTGISAAGISSTGIYGTVTSLNLLALDGQRLYLPDDARIASVLGEMDPAALSLGEVLVVQGVPARDGLCALSAAKFLPIVGQAGELNALTGTLSVLGTTVTLSSKTVIEDESGNDLGVEDVPEGATLAVSGIWSGTTVAASHLRVLPRSRSGFASVTGPIRRGSDGQLVVGNTPVAVGTDARARGIVAAVGQIRDGALQVEDLRPDLAIALGSRQSGTPQAIADALAAPRSAAPGSELTGSDVTGPDGPDARPSRPDRAQVREALEERRAERAEARSDRRSEAREAGRSTAGDSAASPSRNR